jgi:hypothetical protein
MNSGLRLVSSAPILLAKLSVKRTVRVQQTYLRPSPVRKEHETPDGLSASRKLSPGFVRPVPEKRDYRNVEIRLRKSRLFAGGGEDHHPVIEQASLLETGGVLQPANDFGFCQLPPLDRRREKSIKRPAK